MATSLIDLLRQVGGRVGLSALLGAAIATVMEEREKSEAISKFE
jgi:hypothetical protein